MSEPTQTGINKRKQLSPPPDGYVCNQCSKPGHWIQQCPNKSLKKKRKKNKTSGHVPIPGVDPSPDDIEEARAIQRIPPPNCFCGAPSRVAKVKRSNAAGGERSRAVGKYFFFCSKKKNDDKKCRFARPVEDEITPKAERVCRFLVRNGRCKKGNKCAFSHDLAGFGRSPGHEHAVVPKKMVAAEEEAMDSLVPQKKDDHSDDDDNDEDDDDGGSSSSSVSSSTSESGSGSDSDGDEDVDEFGRKRR